MWHVPNPGHFLIDFIRPWPGEINKPLTVPATVSGLPFSRRLSAFWLIGQRWQDENFAVHDRLFGSVLFVANEFQCRLKDSDYA